MDQADLNATAQKWLESLLQPITTEENSFPVPDNIDAGSQDLGVVLERLRQAMKLVESPKTSLRAGGTHLSVLARGLASYLHVSLDSKEVERIGRVLSQQTSQWIINMMKCSSKQLSTLYHDDHKDGLLRALQMALCRTYHGYSVEGIAATSERPPVIYVGDSGLPMDCLHVCARLGLPLSAVCVVPCNTDRGFSHVMDISVLEKKLIEHEDAGKQPLLLVAYAGTPLAGHIEDLLRLREICTDYEMWMHVQGHALSSLCLPVEEAQVQIAREADSLTLCPGTWFGLLSSPWVTLHTTPTIIEVEALPTVGKFPPEGTELGEGAIPVSGVCWTAMQSHGSNRLLSLPLWLSLQYLGSKTLIETVTYCSNLTEHMIAKLEEVPGVRRFGVPVHKSYVVLFKYYGGGEVDYFEVASSLQVQGSVAEPTSAGGVSGVESELKPGSDDRQEGGGTGDEREQEEEGGKTGEEEGTGAVEETVEEVTGRDREPLLLEESQPPTQLVVDPLPLPTANVTNMMIAKDLYHFFPKVGITTLKLPKDGVCFKFDPINSFPEHSTSIEDVDGFVDALKQKVQTLHTTSLLRCLIESTLRGQPNLRCLEFPSFFAGGFIQFVPTDWATKVELTLEEVNKLNKLNMELASELAAKNPVYTPFQHGNFTCIMIKELAPSTDISGFLSELLTKTREFEDRKKFLEGMSQKIVKGIEEAQSDLSKEKQKKDEEQGFLHSIPVVGSLWGWFAPPTPTTPEGRSFNLAQGKVMTTSEIYKHKMQVNDGSTTQPEPSSLTPVKEGEGVGDVSTAAVPAMPSLDQTQDESLQKQEEQAVVPDAGGEGETGEVEGEEKASDEDREEKGGGEEGTTLAQEQS